MPPSSGRAAGQALIRASYDLHPRLVAPDFDGAFEQIEVRVRQRSLLLLFTQVNDDATARIIVRRTRAIARRHLPLLVLFRDTRVHALLDSRASSPEALYQLGAAAEVVRWRNGFIHELERAGAHVLDVEPRTLTTRVINRYLEIKARHLL